MKIYIITSGSYSDYGIRRVFTDLEKAEKYASLCDTDGGYNEARIEEYETEESDFQAITYVDIDYKVNDNGEEYTFKINKTNTLDDKESDINDTYYYGWDYNNEKVILIKRVINNLNYDEQFLKDKYLKVCHDLFAQIKYMQTQGGLEKDIQQWLEGNKPANEI